METDDKKTGRCRYVLIKLTPFKGKVDVLFVHYVTLVGLCFVRLTRTGNLKSRLQAKLLQATNTDG